MRSEDVFITSRLTSMLNLSSQYSEIVLKYEIDHEDAIECCIRPTPI